MGQPTSGSLSAGIRGLGPEAPNFAVMGATALPELRTVSEPGKY